MATIGLAAAFWTMGLIFSSLGPTLPNLSANTRSTLSDISFLFLARALGSLLGSLWGGRLFDRYPGNPVLSICQLVLVATAFIVPLTQWLWVLILIMFIMGIVQGIVNVGGNALLIWVHQRNVGPFMSMVHAFFGSGTLITPLLVAQFVHIDNGITWTYWLLALINLPVAFWFLTYRSPRAPAITAQQQAQPANVWLVVLMSLIFFCYSAVAMAYGGWVTTYTIEVKLADQAGAAYLTSLFWAALTVGRLAAIPIATRFSPRIMLLVDLLGAIASLIWMIAGPATLLTMQIGSIGLGFSVASIFPTTMSLAGQIMPVSGKISGWFSIGGSLGALFVPWVIGQLFEPVGPVVLLIALLVDMLLSLGVFFAITRSLKRAAA